MLSSSLGSSEAAVRRCSYKNFANFTGKLRDSNTGFSLLNFGNFKEHPFSQNIQHLWKHLRWRALQQYLTAFNRSLLLYVDPGYASERQVRNMLKLKKSYVANLMIKQNHSRFSSSYRHHHHHHHHHHQQQQIFAVQLLILKLRILLNSKIQFINKKYMTIPIVMPFGYWRQMYWTSFLNYTKWSALCFVLSLI